MHTWANFAHITRNNIGFHQFTAGLSYTADLKSGGHYCRTRVYIVAPSSAWIQPQTEMCGPMHSDSVAKCEHKKYICTSRQFS